ncbi:MAG: lipopolysaccharide core heptose(I) kinase RfaP [Gammaproteobacteria bacterium]|nr:lipopolysaccharide core heptose(I) kinase RfaP [Gammaproteobacteria bacterium]
MDFSLNPELKKYFALDQNLFDQLMEMRGQVFRDVAGRRTQRIELGGKGYFLKQHFGVGWIEIFKNLMQLRLPVLSANNEKLAIEALEKLSVDTMHLSGYGCRGTNPAALQSFLLTDELAETISLEDFCRDWRTQPAPLALKRFFIKKVAAIARILHTNGINHRDFYICHFLWQPCSQKLFLIDLHRAQIRAKTPLRWIIKDLSGLYFSSKDIGLTSRDLLRFVREYRQRPLRDVLNKEWNFWHKVEQRGDKMYRKHEK